MIASCISAVFTVIALGLFFGFTPESVTADFLRLITPKDSLRNEARAVRGNKKRHRLYAAVMKLKNALEATGGSKRFSVVCFCSLLLFAAGAAFTVGVGNLFLLPAVSVGLAMIPFLYTAHMLSVYERQTKEELETALSVLTTSYLRSEDILSAVRENISYIKPPLKDAFLAFAGDASSVTSDTKQALARLRERIDDAVFREWCDTLICCQEDRTLKDTLLSVVAKMTDVRLVNSQMKTVLTGAKNEYLMMAALVVGNIPLLYVLNKDWFAALMTTTPGKAVLGVCGIVILITAVFMMKFTKPISYKG